MTFVVLDFFHFFIGSNGIISSWIVTALLFIFIVAYFGHYLRHRSDKSAVETNSGLERSGKTLTSLLAKKIPIIAFDRTQRAIHWLLTAVVVFLAVTGFEIYFYPDVANNILTVFSLIYHSDVSAVLLLLILAHVLYDMRKPGSASQMKPSRFDLSTLKERSRAFFSPSGSKSRSTGVAEYDDSGRSISRGGKYDIFMKSYHWMLTASLGVLGVTGFYFWDPYNIVSTFVNIPLWLQAIFLDLHILAAVLTVGLIIGHVYFALLPVNRPILNSLLGGRLEEDYYLEHHDAELWPPNMVKVKSSHSRDSPTRSRTRTLGRLQCMRIAPCLERRKKSQCPSPRYRSLVASSPPDLEDVPRKWAAKCAPLIAVPYWVLIYLLSPDRKEEKS